jgi:hypothetical protein
LELGDKSKGSPSSPDTASGHDKDTLHDDQEEGDIPGSSLTDADQMMDEVYGDHIHQNPGMYLIGGIANDGLWQERW